jgi:hypothetical protein
VTEPENALPCEQLDQPSDEEAAAGVEHDRALAADPSPDEPADKES